MSATIKPVFTDVCGDVPIDSKLVKRLRVFTQTFINKDESSIAFFGGNLMGVHDVKYLPEDRDRWFEEVLDIDQTTLEDNLHDLDVINEDYVRISDTVNLTSVWLLHALHSSPKLSPKEKEQAMIDVAFMLQVKFLTSIFSWYFKYPADPEIAQAVYEGLTYKSDLKSAGSWSALLIQRAKKIIARDSIHYRMITHFDDDADIFYAITDIQGRLREIVKKMYSDLVRLRDNRTRISTTSAIVVLDGTTIVKDRVRNYSTYKRYLHEVIGDRNTFIRDEVIKIILNAMHTLREKEPLLRDVLTYCSLNYAVKGSEEIAELCDETILHAIEYLASNRGLLSDPSDLARLIARLRALYMASRMSDPTLIKMRDLAESIVSKSSKSKNNAVQSALKTALQLYLVLRAFTMNYYSQSLAPMGSVTHS